eukprot:COSAG01_NODE_24523_length_776_cov_0.793205_2_plen_88_part_01
MRHSDRPVYWGPSLDGRVKLRFGKEKSKFMAVGRLGRRGLPDVEPATTAEVQVSDFLAWIGSLCLRHCVHGASIIMRNTALIVACPLH